jgi:hypothetical protein
MVVVKKDGREVWGADCSTLEISGEERVSKLEDGAAGGYCELDGVAMESVGNKEASTLNEDDS